MYYIVLDIGIHYEMITMVSLVTILSPYKVIKLLLTIFLVLYITSLWLIYYITEGLYLLIPFIYLTHLLTFCPSGDCSFVLCIYESVLSLFCLAFRFHI